jgi:replicative DNA helicase
MKNGLNTGIKAFDEMVGEIQPGELIVIAGRPGMGKTTLALQILAKNCIDKKCLYLSTIDNTTMGFNNIACILGNLNRYENEKEVWESVNEVIDIKLNKTLHLWTFDYDFISLSIELTKLKTEKGLDYVFIDGFQLLSPDISVELRAKWLKEVAKALDITIFVTTQMKHSRDCDRIDCTTVNYHLYYTADKVLGVYRKDYFMTIADIGKIEHGESFLCAVKNNTGKQGAITAYFNYARCAFSENFIDEDWYKPTTDIVSIKD